MEASGLTEYTLVIEAACTILLDRVTVCVEGVHEVPDLDELGLVVVGAGVLPVP